jgi:putative FmdB family regulatory protein
MPIYEYRCENGHQFEVIQSMSEDPVTACEECGAPVERVFHPIAVHFKGSGFYNTDYKNNSKTGKDSKEPSTSSSDSKSDKKGDSKKSDGKKSDSKPKAKSSSD